jgi:NADH pyrophosphatase NudC (nudix superfamily)
MTKMERFVNTYGTHGFRLLVLTLIEEMAEEGTKEEVISGLNLLQDALVEYTDSMSKVKAAVEEVKASQAELPTCPKCGSRKEIYKGVYSYLCRTCESYFIPETK